MDATTLGAASAFAAGAVSFVSPCVLPLVPAYMSYITGQSLATNAGAATMSSRVSAAALSVLFVLGFSTVFIALGASATALSRVLLAYRYEAGIAGGALVTLFGLVMLIGVERVPFLRRDQHFQLRAATGNPASAFVLGVAFGFGWTPCIGPILAGILAIAAAQNTIGQGIRLLAAYSMGLAIPFFAAALAINQFFSAFARIRKHYHVIELASGALLVVIGILIFTNRFTIIARTLQPYLPVY